MKITEILAGSLELLKKEPKLFVPRLVTTFIYSIVLLYAVNFITDFTRLLSENQGYGLMWTMDSFTPLYSSVAPMLIGIPVLFLVDLLSYAMYPVLVRDYLKLGKVNLMSSITEALSAWKILLAFTVFVIAAFVPLVIMCFLLIALLLITENIFIYALGAALILIVVFTLIVVLFFMIPAGVIEKKGILYSFKRGFSLGLQNKRDVVGVNVFFLILVLSTLALLSLMEYNKFPDEYIYLTVLVFLAGRFIEALTYTYISVVNPYFYMKVAE